MSKFDRKSIIAYSPNKAVSVYLYEGAEFMQEVKWLDKNTVIPATGDDEVDGWVADIAPYVVDGRPFGAIRVVDPVKFVRKMKAYGVEFYP